MTRVLVAPDSFKGTFSAAEVAGAIGDGVRSAGADAELCPVADGGEGTIEVLSAALGGATLNVPAHDALGRAIVAGVELVGDNVAIVEMARASGLDLIDPSDRDAERASTFGTGEMIVAARAAGVREIIVTIGGSATSDGGEGALEAIDAAGGLGDARLVCFCDVETPYERAAEVFGPQKGADPAAVARLTDSLVERASRFPRDPRGVPGTGAGGGLSGALWAVHDAELRPGADWVLDALSFDERIGRASAVICGEGRLDAQSLSGKIVGAIARRAGRAGVPVFAVVGSNTLTDDETHALGLAAVHEATDVRSMHDAGAAVAATAIGAP